jgi:alpha-tubulin suppressor-like RCC1 family protein
MFIRESPLLAAGTDHSCRLREDRTLRCWGRDYWGELSPPNGQFVAVTSGFMNSCALDVNGNVTCWGSDVGDRSSPPSL